MQQITIGPNQSGQRFDKFLHKYLPDAGSGFLFKMLRKKNITLNGRKAEGKEILQEGDSVSFFLSDETIAKFQCTVSSELTEENEYTGAFRSLKGISVIYEDEHVLILNKPAGILTQKANAADLSLNEWMIGYLLLNNQISLKELRVFRPSVCNRLDRNTSGLVLCGKTLSGSQELSRLIHDRKVKKFYRTVVSGKIESDRKVDAYLTKDEKENRVTVVSRVSEPEKYERIITKYTPVKYSTSGYTYLEVELITGKTHQIRAHLSSLGYPLAGDVKYGRPDVNALFLKNFRLKYQLLHAYRLEFPELDHSLAALSNKTVTAPLPGYFKNILKTIQLED